MIETLINAIKWNDQGLVPVITQDVLTGEVLMHAWMNAQALRHTCESGEMHYFSRSRQSLWHKGATSGHIQKVKSLYVDCDQDSVLALVKPIGHIACHTGNKSCFFLQWDGQTLQPNTASKTKGNIAILYELDQLIQNRRNHSPRTSYVASLFAAGQDKVLKKVIEEAGEVLMASKDQNQSHLVNEVADIIFHLLVLLGYHKLSIQDVLTELERRQNLSGIAEKASRTSNKG
jgi:phosphoribosyl-ATP diphosphatase